MVNNVTKRVFHEFSKVVIVEGLCRSAEEPRQDTILSGQ